MARRYYLAQPSQSESLFPKHTHGNKTETQGEQAEGHWSKQSGGYFLKGWDNSLEANTDVLKKLFTKCRGLQGEWRSASIMWISKTYCRPYCHVTALLLLKIKKSIRTHVLHCAAGSVVIENGRCNAWGMLFGVHLQQEMFPFCLHAAVPVSHCHDYLRAFIHWSCAGSASIRALSWRDVRVTAYIWALLTTMPCFEDQCTSACLWYTSMRPEWDTKHDGKGKLSSS